MNRNILYLCHKFNHDGQQRINIEGDGEPACQGLRFWNAPENR